MMQHELLYVEIYPPSRGQPTLFTIATPRGVFAGSVEYRRRPTVDDVNIWHPVPRWMRPSEVLEPFLP